jgi:hypothetical protein
MIAGMLFVSVPFHFRGNSCYDSGITGSGSPFSSIPRGMNALQWNGVRMR